MLIFSAERFFACGGVLRQIRTECLVAATGVFGNQAGFNVAKRLDDTARESALTTLPGVAVQFRELGLDITAETIDDLVNALKEAGPTQNFQWLMDSVEKIEDLARKELRSKYFLYVPKERMRFWPLVAQPNLFGIGVASKFPSASYDIFNAGTCLATAHSTACVFHLMRVLEIGLAALGKVFGVSLANTNWGPAIDQIQSKVRDMHTDPVWKALPDCKGQQHYYAEAASHFGVLKDAWRNHTMHAKSKYDTEEAERIFDSVKSFMQKLSERIAE